MRSLSSSSPSSFTPEYPSACNRARKMTSSGQSPPQVVEDVTLESNASTSASTFTPPEPITRLSSTSSSSSSSSANISISSFSPSSSSSPIARVVNQDELRDAAANPPRRRAPTTLVTRLPPRIAAHITPAGASRSNACVRALHARARTAWRYVRDVCAGKCRAAALGAPPPGRDRQNMFTSRRPYDDTSAAARRMVTSGEDISTSAREVEKKSTDGDDRDAWTRVR